MVIPALNFLPALINKNPAPNFKGGISFEKAAINLISE